MGANNKPVKIALVGGGAIAETFYLPALARNDDLMQHLVLVERQPDRADKIKQQFGIRHVEDDYHAVLGKVDAAIVAVPGKLHFAISSDFLRHKTHVLCEKPLTETAEEVEELDRLAAEHGVTIGVNNTRRLFPSYKKVKQLISEDAVGTVQRIEYYEGGVFNWPAASGSYFDPERPRGILADRGAHVLDLIAWWLDDQPIEITSSFNDSFGGAEGAAHLAMSSRDVEIDVKLSWLNKLENKYRIIGDGGTLTGDIYDWRKVALETGAGNGTTYKDAQVKEYGDFAGVLLDDLVEVVRTQKPPLVPGRDVKQSIDLINRAYQQARRFELDWYKAEKALSAEADRREKVLITGSGGFVGGWIAEAFHLSGEYEVHAGIRSWSGAARIGRFPVRIVPCDVLDKDQLDKAVADVDRIVHCAVGPRDVTVQGTANVLEAAKKHGIKRVVHISTIAVYGDASGTVDETAPCTYSGNAYADTKIDAEKACWQYREQGVPVTILRPTIIYGPFSKTWTMRFAERLRSGQWGVIEPYGNGHANLLYIEDLLSAIRLALVSDQAVGEAFNVSGPQVITWNEYFSRFNSLLGLPKLPTINGRRIRGKASVYEPVRRLAKFMLGRFGKLIMKAYVRYDLAKMVMKDVEHSLKATPTVAELDMFSRTADYSTEKAERLLGYMPACSVEQGLSTSVKWLVQHGLVERRPQDT